MSAARIAPSLLILPATTAAFLRVSGASTVLSPDDRVSKIGTGLVRRTDAKTRHPAGPIRLIDHLRSDQLGCAGPCCCCSRARTAMMHDDGDSSKQCLLIDIADGKAVCAVVDQRQIGRALGQNHAAALRANRADGDMGSIVRCGHGHTAKTDIGWRISGIEELCQAFRQGALVREAPVCTVSTRSVGAHGPSSGSDASHGRLVKT